MNGWIHKKRTGHDPRLWPVLLLLLVVVLAPTVCLLWFMSWAIENERLAMRQTLEQSYRRDLAALQTQLEGYWQQRALALDDLVHDRSASAAFAQAVRSGTADSLACYDDRGQVSYPSAPRTSSSSSDDVSAEWLAAERLEFTDGDPLAATDAYAAIARHSADVNLVARALQAQARCLVKAGRKDDAIRLVTQTVRDPQYDLATDMQGRLITPSAQLLALQLMPDKQHPDYVAACDRLRQRLQNYDDTAMAATQRRFLLHELSRLQPAGADLPTLSAEDLAARFVETHPSPRRDVALHPSQLSDVWQLASPQQRVVALFRTETVRQQSDRLLAQAGLPPGVRVNLLPPDSQQQSPDVLFSLPAGQYQPGWQLTLSLKDAGPTDATASGRIALYVWTGVLVIAGMGLLAGWIAQVFRRQMRLAQLKNDLVATVSHELKTPLSSMRLLVDTLLDESSPNPARTKDYLQLIAKENSRLSRLIDNFLAFSRMVRNRHAFQFAETDPASVLRMAIEAMGERLEAPRCEFRQEIAADLPRIVADPDALVTVVLNLLDNAWKYTEDPKRISLRAYTMNSRLCIAVTDNGIGLTKSAAKKIFQRFYQVDRRLARATGGCGLGLSIVKYIVDAHGGTVEVTSQPGQGSTFLVALPSHHDRRETT